MAINRKKKRIGKVETEAGDVGIDARVRVCQNDGSAVRVFEFSRLADGSLFAFTKTLPTGRTAPILHQFRLSDASVALLLELIRKSEQHLDLNSQENLAALGSLDFVFE